MISQKIMEIKKMRLKPIKKDGGGYGNLDMANQHESDKETPIRHGRQGKDEKSETYIGLPARNGKKMTLNKIQHTKVGDDIHFFVNGQENRGVVVKMGGTYVSVFKEDGNIHEIPINETFFVKDILVNKTWDDMTGEERTELLQNAHAYSPRFLAKNWDDLPRELKTVLSEKATGMEQNHAKDNLEVEDANHAQTGYAQTQQNTLGKVAPAVGLGAAVGAGLGRAVGGYAGKKIGEKVAEHRSDKNPTRGRRKKDLFGVDKDAIDSKDNENTPSKTQDGLGLDAVIPVEGARQSSQGQSHDVRIPYEDLDEGGSKYNQATSWGGGTPDTLNARPKLEDARFRGSDGDYEKDRSPAKRKSIDGTLKAILQLKSDVEAGKYGNVGNTAEVGVSTDTPLDVSEESGYEERPHISLEEVGQLPRADAKEHHANEVKETGKKQKIEPHEVKQDKKKGEDGQTGAINTSEGGAFNPVYNAYDTPITPEETKTGRKIAGRDQIKKGIPIYNVNSWGIRYVTKEDEKKDE